MPQLTFLPSGENFEVSTGTRVLAFAVKNKVPLKYGCASCRCGTCVAKVSGKANEMQEDEKSLLSRMGLLQAGIRLVCRLVVAEYDLVIDLESQSQLEIRDHHLDG